VQAAPWGAFDGAGSTHGGRKQDEAHTILPLAAAHLFV
jgi:hypothetical protein